MVFCWGAVLCGMAAARNFGSLMATRFLLGSFEASVAPTFIAIVQMWYRRSEQVRIVQVRRTHDTRAELDIADESKRRLVFDAWCRYNFREFAGVWPRPYPFRCPELVSSISAISGQQSEPH